MTRYSLPSLSKRCRARRSSNPIAETRRKLLSSVSLYPCSRAKPLNTGSRKSEGVGQCLNLRGMKLNDIRRFAIRQHVRVRFPLSNGMECIVNEHGISRVPQLEAPAEFNLEKELSHIDCFSIEPIQASGSRTAPARSRTVSREELQVMAAATGSPVAQGHDHED